VFPYREGLSIEQMLNWLAAQGFILRYKVQGQGVIQIINFEKHQNPHKNELPSELPCHSEADKSEPEPIGSTPEKIGSTRADSLSLDSLSSDSPFIDSLNTDSLRCEVVAVAPPAPREQRKPSKPPSADPSAGAVVWDFYADAYEARYGALPVRNAKVNAQITQLVARLGAVEAPLVAAFYVGHNGQFYVRNGHSVGNLLADAEKLRTEWLTKRQVTDTQARQIDKTQSNFDAFAPLIAAAEAKERREREESP